MYNSFGNLFRITSFGESHGPAIGVVIDGCPAGLSIDLSYIQYELDRRKPGQSKLTTQRREPDEFEVLSGLYEEKTTGSPICLLIRNSNAKSKDYDHIKDSFRPSHADFTYQQKYGHRDHRGGGRSSARETASRVAAGAIAKMMLHEKGITINAYVSSVGDIDVPSHEKLDLSLTETTPVRCPDPKAAEKMIELIDEVRKSRDTIGGTVSCVIKNTPPGLGEPVFQKLHAALGGAMLSINAVKGFEYGSGFKGTKMKGSEHNDHFYTDEDGRVRTRTNYSGGIQGGISNGEEIYFKVAFKPVATIMQDQPSIDKEGNEATISGKGRHDPCVVPRAVPIVEAMAALVLADFYLMHQSAKLRP